MEPPAAVFETDGREHDFAAHDRDANFARLRIGSGVGYEYVAIMNAPRCQRLTHHPNRIDVWPTQV